MSYYDEIKAEIETALNNGDLEEARYLLKREFSMPYIPEDVERSLNDLKQRLRFLEADKYERKEASMDHLLHQLKGRPASQISAVNALADRNLRTIVPQLQDWLSKDPVPEAAAMLIELLAEQEIPEEFTITRDGVEYTFAADAVIPVTRSEGFLHALHLLADWLEKEPSLLELARTVLISKCYLALPLSYDASEASGLALDCVREVTDAMGMQELYEQIELKAQKNTEHRSLS